MPNSNELASPTARQEPEEQPPRTNRAGSSREQTDLFRRFAHRTSCVVGTPGAFIAACVVILVWSLTGPLFHYSDTWQLVINTGTTIITFLMVFLIQTTQNRDASAIHLKLDELIVALKGARNDMVAIEHLSEEELQKFEHEFEDLSARARALRKARPRD